MKTDINGSRRRFLTTSGAAAGTFGSLGLGFSNRVKAGANVQTKLLVYIFLRGGMDGLSFMIPTSGANHDNYQNARQATYIDPAQTLDLFSSGFGLHPNCLPLHEIRSNVAFIHACGHPPDSLTRSHFDAQEQIELGTPGSQASQQGFLTRYLQSFAHDPEAIFTSMAAANNVPISLSGYTDVATVSSSNGFSPNSGRFADTHLSTLREIYNGAGELDLAGQATVDAVELINSFDLSNYQSADPTFPYPNSDIGEELALVAQLWGLNLGISAATVNSGGWDTHTDQRVLVNSGFGGNIRDVAEAVRAMYSDLAAQGRADDLAIVIQSEFGRQVSENGNAGTDHGFGNPMVVLSGRVNGGVYGTFPGIAIPQREGDAVLPTTDFRTVHATVMDQILGNGANLDAVFPDFNYSAIPFTL